MSRQQPKPTVVYHGECSDGFSAAYAVWLVYGNDAAYYAAAHGGDLPGFREGSDLIFVDFTYPREVMLALAAKHRSILVLDHHKTAQAALDGIEGEATNITVVFDLSKSGAVLAWEYFHPTKPVPLLFQYVQDRDLWTWTLPHAREVTAAIYAYDQTWANWNWLMARSVDELVAQGAVLEQQLNKQLTLLLREVQPAWIAGHLVPVCNAPFFLASDLANRLLQQYPEAPFAGVYRFNGRGEMHWSLRSEDTRVDVGLVASALGGGGHRNAAGFRSNSDRCPAVLVPVGPTYEEAACMQA